MAPFLLPLNDTAIVFLHPEDTGLPVPYAVQVTVKSEGAPDIGTIASYYLAQHDIADVVVGLACAHCVQAEFPRVVFEGEFFTLAARRNKWKYGKEIKLLWGTEEVIASDFKWNFVFSTTPGGV